MLFKEMIETKSDAGGEGSSGGFHFFQNLTIVEMEF